MLFKKSLLVIVCSAALAACGNSKSPTETQSSEQTAGTQSQTISLTSKAGDITIPANVSRIAVLDTNALNTIHALGADNKVVSVPKGTKLPQALEQFSDAKYTDIGTAKEPNLERIAASRPELILMNGRMENMMGQIKQIAPTYFVDIDYNNQFDSFKNQTLTIAEIVGEKPKAEQALQQLQTDIDQLKEKTKGKTALVVMVINNKLAAYGAGSRFGNIYDLYGFTPIDPTIKVGLHGMSISPEFIAEKNPDYIFVVDRGSAISENNNSNAKQVLNNAIVNKTKAAQNNNLVFLDSSNWYLMNNGLAGMQAMVKEVADAVDH